MGTVHMSHPNDVLRPQCLGMILSCLYMFISWHLLKLKVAKHVLYLSSLGIITNWECVVASNCLMDISYISWSKLIYIIHSWLMVFIFPIFNNFNYITLNIAFFFHWVVFCHVGIGQKFASPIIGNINPKPSVVPGA